MINYENQTHKQQLSGDLSHFQKTLPTQIMYIFQKALYQNKYDALPKHGACNGLWVQILGNTY